MKIIAFLMLIVGLQMSKAGHAQVISLHLKNAPLNLIIEQISGQSGYHFLFGNELLKEADRQDVDLDNVSLETSLKACLSKLFISFSIVDNTVVLKKASVEPSSPFINRQVYNVRGIVTDEDGRSLSNVSIKNLRNNRSTSSNRSGSFSILGNKADELEFSFLGFHKKKVVVGDPDELIKIQLVADPTELSDVVVVGYGTVKRKDLTGSVASVNPEEFKNAPFTSIDQALTGKAAGVQVIQADGSPGGVAKIRIRGGTSLMGGNDPLYIIDGVQVAVQNRYIESSAELVNPIDRFGSDNPNSTVSGAFARGLNSLAGLNINDIESIDILKDASATAIYGSRAANGVVIITTKRGKKDMKPMLEANYYHAFNVDDPLELLNRDQYLMVMREANQNLFNEMLKAGETITPEIQTDFDNRLNNPDYYGTANTDWINLVTRTGQSNNADFSVKGGGNASQYFVSMGYNGTQGTVLGTDFNRLTSKIRLDNEITSKLRVQANVNYAYTKNNITNGLYTQALFAPPTYPAFNEDGSIYKYSGDVLGSYDYEGFQNPMALLDGINRAQTHALLGSLSADYRILPELTFRSVVSVNYNNTHQRNYVSSDALIVAENGVGSSNQGTGAQSQNESTDLFYENTLTWDRQFNADHRINVVAGTSWQKNRYSIFGVTAQGYPDDKILNNLSSASLVTAAEGTSGQNSLLSFYIRANYAFKERYLFTFTGRSDASSKFPKENRTGYFPSGGVAWRISDEPFLKKVNWINELKIRASAGYTGTQNIGDNMFYTLYTPYSYGGVNAMVPTQLGNERIKWESTLQKDAGIDIGLFDSRLQASLGVYEKKTSGILFTTPLAESSSYSSVVANLANIRNRGLEIDIRGDFIRNSVFSWSGSYNMSFNRSLVTHVDRDFTDPAAANEYSFGNAIIREGEPVGLLYGSQFESIIQTEEQLAAYKEKNIYWMYFDPYLGIGDPLYHINDGDYFASNDVIGHAEPKFYGGYSNTLRYKGLSLITLFTFTYGGDVLYLGDILNTNVGNRANKTTAILGRWTPENPNNERPRLIYGGNTTAYTNSSAVYDASFLKLKTLTLTYQFPAATLHKWNIPSLTIYGAATNVFTITGYPGADPEVSNDPYSLINGSNDSGTYPAVRQYTLGFRFTL